MLRVIRVPEKITLENYNSYSSLTSAVRDLITESSILVPRFRDRKVWMVNSTEKGGGVAEMMPGIISMSRQLGIKCEWVVTCEKDTNYFITTKKIHNLIHGDQQNAISSEERLLYENINHGNALELLDLVSEDDIIVIHDPQPMAMAMFMKEKKRLSFIWRCHIGSDIKNQYTEQAWSFLSRYAKCYDHAVFSATEYIPDFFSGRATVIHPGIDPLNHKNRELPVNKLVGILCNAHIIKEYHPVLTPPFTNKAKRLQPDGSFQSPLMPGEPGILFSPSILQISRWDKLKGFLPLLNGFRELKLNALHYSGNSDRQLRQIELALLVLAGPDPDYVDDDPEGKAVLKELTAEYLKLEPEVQGSIAILKLPMQSRKENELIVNALQRVATVVIQNSIREGFGLTVTEAMLKAKPVIGTNACGIREQIRDEIDGKLISNPEDEKEIASVISHTLKHHLERGVWEVNAQKRAAENFLIFHQVKKWIRLFAEINGKASE